MLYSYPYSLFYLLPWASVALALTSNLGPVIDLGYAAFAGNATLPNVQFFGGIPYAKPPLGNLRFSAPQLLDEKGRARVVTDARNWGPICLQQPAVVGIGSEDCLTLNIWKPANAKAGDNLPVIVYIHGGGDFANSAQGFPMNDWVVQSNGTIVAVNIQYRLGLLGFLASSTVMSHGDVNAGLLDQRAALGWVKRHIASFGGDPDHVTISGESSGGASVVYHMLAFGGRNDSLFSGVIAQSIGTDPVPTTQTYESCFSNVTLVMGCASLAPAETMECLRSASLGSIVAAVNNRGKCGFLPIIDGSLIQDLPSRMINSGKILNVNFIGGHTTDDGSVFAGNPVKITSDDTFVASITKRYTNLSNSTIAQMLELYPLADFSSQGQRAAVAFADTVFACQDWFIAQKLISLGVKNVWNYRFNTPDPVQLAANPWEGVMHTSDLYYLFDGTNSGPSATVPQPIFHAFNATEKPFANEVVSYWTSFARAFDPNAFKLGEASGWPLGPDERLVLQEGNSTLSGGNIAETVDEVHKTRCLFWVGVGNETRV